MTGSQLSQHRPALLKRQRTDTWNGILLLRQTQAWKMLGLSTGTLENENAQFLQTLHVHSPFEHRGVHSLLLSHVQPVFDRLNVSKIAMGVVYNIIR